MVKRSREDSVSSSADTASSPPYAVSSPEAESRADVEEASAPLRKYKHLEVSQSNKEIEVMQCALPPHREAIHFSSYDAFEVHYAQFHVNRCSECRNNFPTAHFLELHIEENHDPLNEARKAKGEKIYRCFVEDCDRVCSAPEKRRRHLIDKHMFPREYDFFVVNDGIDKRRTMLRSRQGHRRKSSAAERARQRSSLVSPATTIESMSGIKEAIKGEEGDKPDVMDANTGETPDIKGDKSLGDSTTVTSSMSKSPAKPEIKDEDMSDLASSMSALKFVPPSIRFGRGRGKGGFSSR